MLARISFFLAAVVTSTAQLSVSPCYRNDPNVNECFRNFLNSLKPLLQNGIKELGISSPMVIDFLNITHKSPNNDFNIILKNFTLYNVFDYEITEVDLRGVDILTNVKFGEIKAESVYALDGTVMGLKTRGTGIVTGKSVSSQAKIEIEKKLVLRNEIEYCQVLRVKTKLKSSRPSIHFSGLQFELTNKFLSDNPKELQKLLSAILGKVMSSVLQKYVGLLCDIVPYNMIIQKRQEVDA